MIGTLIVVVGCASRCVTFLPTIWNVHVKPAARTVCVQVGSPCDVAGAVGLASDVPVPATVTVAINMINPTRLNTIPPDGTSSKPP